jgi:hypothetical protein
MPHIPKSRMQIAPAATANVVVIESTNIQSILAIVGESSPNCDSGFDVGQPGLRQIGTLADAGGGVGFLLPRLALPDR